MSEPRKPLAGSPLAEPSGPWFDLIDDPTTPGLEQATAELMARLVAGPRDDFASEILITWATVQARVGVARWNEALLIGPQLARLRRLLVRRLMTIPEWGELWRAPRLGAPKIVILRAAGATGLYDEADTAGAGVLPPHPDEILGPLEPDGLADLAATTERAMGGSFEDDERTIFGAGLTVAYGVGGVRRSEIVLPRSWSADGAALARGLGRMETAIRSATMGLFMLAGMVDSAEAYDARIFDEIVEQGDARYEIPASPLFRPSFHIVASALLESLPKLRWLGPKAGPEKIS